MSKKPNYLKISNLKAKPKCMAPWTQLWAKVLPQGYVIKPCCVYEDEFHTDNIDEYLNSDELKQLTETLEKGELPPSCWRCTNGDNEWQTFENEIQRIKVQSHKEVNGNGYQDYDVDALTKIMKDDDDKFTMLDIRPGNLCNLKCRTCNATSSTEIAKEHIVMKKDKEFIKKLTELNTDDTQPHLLSRPEKYFEKYADHNYSQSDEHKKRIYKLFDYANIRRVKLLGGEPSIDPAIISIMKKLINDGYDKNNHFRLQIVTNMTNVNKVWKDYFSKLNTRVTASVDGAGRSFEYIRYPAKWKTIEKNIKSLSKDEFKECRPVTLAMNIVMSNILYLDIKNWAPKLQKLQNETSNFTINFIECTFPKHLNVDIIPQKYKKLIIKDIDDLMNKVNNDGKSFFNSRMISLLARAKREVSRSLFRQNNIDLLESFFMIMMKQDELRNQNIFDINYTKQMYDEYMVDLPKKI